MAKNCHTCKFFDYGQYLDSDGHDDGSGHECAKRYPTKQLLAQIQDLAYQLRYKRCFEATPTTDAPQAKGSEVGNA